MAVIGWIDGYSSGNRPAARVQVRRAAIASRLQLTPMGIPNARPNDNELRMLPLNRGIGGHGAADGDSVLPEG